MARNVYYVLSDRGGWKVTHQGGTVISTHANKDDAISPAVTIAKANQPSQVKVQKQDGTWDEERTYGDDPFPPEGQAGGQQASNWRSEVRYKLRVNSTGYISAWFVLNSGWTGNLVQCQWMQVPNDEPVISVQQ